MSGCSRLPFDTDFSTVIHPKIVPSPAETGSETAEQVFDFEDAQVRLGVPIDRAVYAGAVSAQKNAIFVGRSEPVDWVGDYYRAFVDEEHQAAFYESTAEASTERDAASLGRMTSCG